MAIFKSPAFKNTLGSPSVPSSILNLPKIACALIILICLLVFSGWLLDIEFLKSVIPGEVAMNPVTATAFILSSTALWLSRVNISGSLNLVLVKRIAFICAITVVFIGVIRLLEYVAGWDVFLDRVLFATKLAAASGDPNIPNRIAPNTALNFFFAGFTLLLSGYKDKRLGWLIQGALIFVFFTSFVAFLGHVYDAPGLYRMFPFIGMAVNTAACFMILALGIFASNPDQYLMSIVASPQMGGIVARRLLPVAFILLVALGWIQLWGQQKGFYGTETGLGLMVTVSMVLLTMVILIISASLNRADSNSRRAEESLLNAEKRYMTTLDHMLEGCQVIGFDWRYLYINDVAAKQGRNTREELLGRTMMEMYPDIEQSQMFSNLQRCMVERIARRTENEFNFSDGTKGWFQLSMEPVPEGVFILSEDITKEKQLYEELRKHREHLEELVVERTAQLESANKELEAFSYSVSHDLRAPLRAIDGFSKILLETNMDKLDDEGKRLLNIVSENTGKMGQLIDDILSLSRVGRREFQLSKIDMEKLANTVWEELKPDAAGRNLQFEIKPLPPASGDPSMIRQVFINLISNAIKFTRPKKVAIIEIGAIEETVKFSPSTPLEKEFAYYVKDNGVGFDALYAGKLFGAFQRMHRADEFEGTGIGLAIVQRIIHKHGGKVWAEGEVQKGAKFYFTLPG